MLTVQVEIVKLNEKKQEYSYILQVPPKDLYVFLAFASCLESIVLKLFSCTQLCCYCKCPTSLFEFSTFCTPVKILANNNES